LNAIRVNIYVFSNDYAQLTPLFSSNKWLFKVDSGVGIRAAPTTMTIMAFDCKNHHWFVPLV
jgi:hypothetical protein